MPHGANTIKKKQNGTKPNKQKGKILQKKSFPNQNTIMNLTLGFKNSKTKSMDWKIKRD